ncbi:copper amine oxidase N-terminal domain-containing protein [Paenibacillus sp. sgz500958]|uniref:copper amine oxidase N-terminal domain-containing protein n=1 Tax=Paenibacillus sp. sgz500958 TaxID=3242475 RepID=UPI0036D2CB97
MSKLIYVIALSAVLSTSVLSPSMAAAATQPVKITIEGIEQHSKVAPYKVDGSYMVPMKDIFTALGATFEWNKANQQIKAVKAETTIVMTIGSKKALLNGKEVTLNSAPQVINGNTMVPLQFVSVALNSTAVFDSKTNTIVIKQKAAARIDPEVAAAQKLKDEEEIKKILTAHLTYLANQDAVGFRSVFEKPFETVEFLNKYFAEKDGTYRDTIESFGEITITGNQATAKYTNIHDILGTDSMGKKYIAARLKYNNMPVELVKVNGVWKIRKFISIKAEQIPLDSTQMYQIEPAK